jgi:hypothetical protein
MLARLPHGRLTERDVLRLCTLVGSETEWAELVAATGADHVAALPELEAQRRTFCDGSFGDSVSGVGDFYRERLRDWVRRSVTRQTFDFGAAGARGAAGSLERSRDDF